MFRLYYNKIDDDEIKSNEVTSKKGVTYYAKINYKEGMWRIFNAKRRNVIRQGFSTNKNVLRRMVRREFIKLGVKLLKEFKKNSGYATTKKDIL